MSPNQVILTPNMTTNFNLNCETKTNEHMNSKTYRDILAVASYVVKKHLGKEQKWNKIGEKAYQLCTEMRYKHEPFFNGVCSKLNIQRNTVGNVTQTVLDGVWSDGQINFGRVVSVLTFCMVLSEFCIQDEELQDKVGTVVETTAEVIFKERVWFENSGGWDGFMKNFSNPSETIWKGFVITTVGLSAVAGLLYAKS